ncbi:MAG: asparagine synthetase B, partial [Caldilineaceae bacterium]|nr:asparagine synthetase B [Caldilineaceae bacterium]
MSGILGVINLDGAPVDRKQLVQMTNYMAFRGPDHQDIWLKQQVGFGHTLLRTTFEAEREQGITTLDGQVWITADVRLDGREELIGKLAAKGRQLEAQVTDVELVLHAYHLWGEDALDHLMGDFAFGIWDERAQRLFCAHDHFGVVPFYYAKVKNCLIFSNTLNALRLHPAVSDTLNEQTIGDFLLVGYYPNLTTTTFADIQRLPPAHSLVWAGDALAIRRYYQLTEETNSVHYRRPAEYIQHFQSIFDQAVADRLRTAKAGTFLSGGMDSTSIAVTAQALLRATGKPFDFRAYTIVYEHLVTDQEGYYAGLVAEASAIPIEYLVAETYLQAPPLDTLCCRVAGLVN